MARWTLPLILAVGLSPAANADTFRGGRIRLVEPGATFQRATETTAEEAAPNLPFLPGDRVWTDQTGRIEFQFDDGTMLRVDNRTKLDYVAHDDRRDDRAVLRLWSGGLYVHGRDPRMVVETPGGLVQIARGGIYRVDVDSGEARLSVYEGEAGLEGQRVSAGERAYVRRGEAVQGPERFDRASGDDFAQWDQERSQHDAWAQARPEYLPEEVAPYAGELEGNGTWYYETEVGNVWRPYVGSGWRPYTNGRWVWTAYGWTWVPSERWGWAPSHYGRWGFSGSLGWYWVPTAGWGPGWVSWAVGSSTVGWCPLGFHDRPVTYDRGRAVPRGTAAGASNPWVFVRREDLGTRDVATRRIAADMARDVRIIDSPHARLTRDGQVSARDGQASEGERATPRAIRTKPGPGDTTPELRADPITTIPAAVPRTRYESEREREREREREADRRRPAPRNDERMAVPTSRPEPSPAGAPAERTGRSHPTDVRSSPAGAVAIGQPREDGRNGSPASESPDREVMRPLFRPLGRPEGQGQRDQQPSQGDAGSRRPEAYRPSPQSGSRSTPPVARPPQVSRPPEARPATPAPAPAREGAARRKKEDN